MLIPIENQYISPIFNINISTKINISTEARQLYHYYPSIDINIILTSGHLTAMFVLI